MKNTPKYCTWNITSHCNLTCIHCCGVLPGSDLLFTEKQAVLERLVDFGISGIGISGGEPFLKKEELLALIQIMSKEYRISLGINTNGMVLDDETCMTLAKMEDLEVIVSLEGPEITNDIIRGKKTFKKVKKGISLLSKYKIPFKIVATLSRLNIHCIGPLVEYAKACGALGCGIGPLLPVGKACTLDVLTSAEAQEVCTVLYAYYKKYKGEMIVTTTFPFSFLVDEALAKKTLEKRKALNIRNCGMGSTRLFISPSGHVTPCVFIHEDLGSTLKVSLEDIWGSDSMERYRKAVAHPGGRCGVCVYREVCGGCRASAYHIAGDINAEDPLCWYNPVERL